MLRGVRQGRRAARAASGYNRSIQYWKPAFQNSRDRQRRDARPARARPVELHRAARGRVAAGLDRDPERAQVRSSPTSPRPPTRSPTSRSNLSARDRRAAAHAARRPARARRAQRRRSRRCAASRRDLRPAVALVAARRSTRQLPLVQQLRGLVAERRAAGPRRATCARRCPTLVELNAGGVAAAGADARCCRAASNNVITPWQRGRRSRTRTSSRPGPIYQEASSGCRASPPRAATSTPTASTSARSPTTRTTPTRSATAASSSPSLPVQGVNPPQAGRSPPLRARRAVRDAGAAGPALAAPRRRRRQIQHQPGRAGRRRARARRSRRPLRRGCGDELKRSALGDELHAVRRAADAPTEIDDVAEGWGRRR